ncbi:MAG TPA: mechanosensitive ion channel family protein [Woeseiaceae bacterium]|nr:mechanosensitive ion channel family protein [Woeseiaceae bacterium]
MNPTDWLDYEIFGNAILSWSVAAGLFVTLWLGLLLVRRLLIRRLGKPERADASPLALDVAVDVIRATRGWFLFLIALFVGSRLLQMPDSVSLWTARATMIAILLQLGLWLSAGIVKTIQTKRKRHLEESPDGVAAMDILSFIARVTIWSIVLLAALDNLGVNITTMIAGLGVGGIAVALAAQNILGDLFASLSIVLDKPFAVGDFLVIGDFFGRVEKVGIKTTRLRSLSGEQLVFSNNDLLNSRIRNYGRMFERRVLFSLGVTYQTGADKLKAIPDMLRAAVKSQQQVRFDRAHFQKYGDFALVFEVVYFVLSADYNQYMDIQQAINLKIYEEFEANGIDFAYPTQTLYLSRTG